MKDFLTGGVEREKSGKEISGIPGRGERKSLFTGDFFKFLLGFAVIIALSFIILTVAGKL